MNRWENKQYHTHTVHSPRKGEGKGTYQHGAVLFLVKICDPMVMVKVTPATGSSATLPGGCVRGSHEWSACGRIIEIISLVRLEVCNV
jgi:hypothetical protein